MIKSKTLQNIFLLLCSLFFFFLIIEIGIRIFVKDKRHYFPHPRFLYELDEHRGYKLAKNFRGVFRDPQNEYIARADTNSIGLRDYEYGEKGENTFRILVLGDSFTFGAGVEFEETFVRQLETILREKNRNRKYEVINAGVLGYGTDQEYYFLKEWGFKLKPDLVIVAFYIQNDLEDVMIGALNHYTVRDGYLFDLFSYKQKERGKNFFERYSRTYEFIEDRVNNLLIKTGFKKKPWESSGLPLDMKFYLKKYPPKFEEAMNKTKGFLKGIDSLEKQIGGKSLIVLIPTRDQVFDGWWMKKLERFHENPSNYNITRVNDEIADLAKENKIPFLDLLHSQREYEKEIDLFLTSDSHWNKEGHKLVAKTIYDFLVSNGMVQ